MNNKKLKCAPPTRYIESVIAVAIVKRYFNKLARCGKACFESQKRRMHCNARQMGGSAARKPSNTDLLESHRTGSSQETAYKRKKSSAFCQRIVSYLNLVKGV
jgi:hypothetical protein